PGSPGISGGGRSGYGRRDPVDGAGILEIAAGPVDAGGDIRNPRRDRGGSRRVRRVSFRAGSGRKRRGEPDSLGAAVRGGTAAEETGEDGPRPARPHPRRLRNVPCFRRADDAVPRKETGLPSPRRDRRGPRRPRVFQVYGPRGDDRKSAGGIRQPDRLAREVARGQAVKGADMRRALLGTCLLALACGAFAQEGFPLFTPDFPPEEFAARRGGVYEAIGKSAVAILQGAPTPLGYTRFRQSNDFYYLCGIEVPNAYLVLDGASRKATLYLPHRNDGRERGEGKMLSAEDAEEVVKLAGMDAVFGTDLLAEQLARALQRRAPLTRYTPLFPPEGFAGS